MSAVQACVTPMCPLPQSVKIEFACINSLQHDFIGFETEDAGGQDETAVSAWSALDMRSKENGRALAWLQHLNHRSKTMCLWTWLRRLPVITILQADCMATYNILRETERKTYTVALCWLQLTPTTVLDISPCDLNPELRRAQHLSSGAWSPAERSVSSAKRKEVF